MERIEPEIKKDGLTLTRLEAFSDGVFAIAITLLILEVKIPSHADLVQSGGLKAYLVQLWPSYFAYFFSFFVIGVYWANHHYLCQFFIRTDHYFSMLTILFLMSMAFLPYPTALLGDFIADETQRGTAISFYIFGGLLFPALTWNLMWRYASFKNRITDTKLKESFVKKLSRLYTSSFIFISVIMVLSFFFPVISVVIVVAVNLYFLKAPFEPEYNN